jgi:hypothetical protein
MEDLSMMRSLTTDDGQSGRMPSGSKSSPARATRRLRRNSSRWTRRMARRPTALQQCRSKPFQRPLPEQRLAIRVSFSRSRSTARWPGILSSRCVCVCVCDAVDDYALIQLHGAVARGCCAADCWYVMGCACGDLCLMCASARRKLSTAVRPRQRVRLQGQRFPPDHSAICACVHTCAGVTMG